MPGFPTRSSADSDASANTGSVPKIAFMGTPEFAVPGLRACCELGEVVVVVTQPDKPRGRGQEVSVSPVKAEALARGIPVLQPEKIRGTNFAEELRRYAPDVSVVIAYGKILPADVLEVPPHGSVNAHASLLPRFRGAAPIQWAIASGDASTGVCLMKMDVGMDTGPVFAREELPIAPTETGASLHDALSKLSADMLRRHLKPYLEGQRPLVPQPSEGAVPAPMIRKEDGALDFSRPAVVLERRLRAFTPWPGAFTQLDGKRLRVLQARVGEGAGHAGTVLRADATGVEVACGEGSLVLLELQLEGKKALGVREFLLGTPIREGATLSRPEAR